MGVSGRAMLDALIDGQRDPQVLADLAKRRMRGKIPELAEALTGRFREHWAAFLARLHLEHVDRLTASIDALTARIDRVIAPFQPELELLATIPGIARHTAEVIVAEIGGHIELFPTAGHLASWAGVAPGQHESAGRKKSVHTRPGNSYLKGALGTATFAASQTNGTYLQASLPAPVCPARPDAGPGRDRSSILDRALAHAHHHQPLPGPRR